MVDVINKLIVPDGKNEWRQHWPVVATTMLGYMISVIHLYSIGVMIAPLQQKFGWSRAEITSGLLIISVVVAPLAPLMGMAIDHFGPRRIALCGVTIYCASIALLSLAQPPIWTWWLLWAFVGVGNLFLAPTVWTAAITSLFSASRGLALAVSMSATGIISSGGPPLTYFLIEHCGWRTAFVLWGAVPAAIGLPLLYLFFSSAKDETRTGPIKKSSGSEVQAKVGPPFRERVKSVALLKLASAGFIMSIVSIALIVNIVPILTSFGMRPANAAAIAAIVGISQIVGRLTGGYLLDRLNARWVGAVIMIFLAVTCLILIAFRASIPFATVAVLIFGLSIGAEMDVLAYLAARFFGLQKFGTLYGFMVGLLTFGGGLAPVLASLSYDLSGSYLPVLWAIVPLCLLTGYLFLALGPYPKLDEVN